MPRLLCLFAKICEGEKLLCCGFKTKQRTYLSIEQEHQEKHRNCQKLFARRATWKLNSKLAKRRSMGASHNNTHLQQQRERGGGEGKAALDKWQMGWAIGKLDFYALPGGCKQTNQLWIIIAHQSFSQSARLPPPYHPLSLSICLSGKCRVSFKFRQQNKAHNRPRQETDSRNRPSFECRNWRKEQEEGTGRREECPEVMMILCAFAENFSVRFLRTFV